jgi:hypothetical protein
MKEGAKKICVNSDLLVEAKEKKRENAVVPFHVFKQEQTHSMERDKHTQKTK